MIQPYTKIQNSIIQDTRLSYGATGLLCYMLSKPKDWKFNVQHLSAQKKDKRFSTRQLLKELESLGLVAKKRITDQQGRVKEWNFQLNPESNFRILDTIPESNFQIVDNQPQTSKSPESNFPEVGNSTSGKSDTSNKREEVTKEKKHIKMNIPPTIEQVQEYAREVFPELDCQHFIDYYTARGWMMGKHKMKDWQACVRTWKSNKKPPGKQPHLMTSKVSDTEYERMAKGKGFEI